MEAPLIYQTITKVMSQIGAIGKDRKNTMQNFQYRGIDDVMNELHGIMAKEGLFVVPAVLEENRSTGKTKNGGDLFFTRLKISFKFYAQDGSNIESIVIGEAMDSGDKASNKALSIGLKYALLQVFCIPTEEEKDPDATSYETRPETFKKEKAQLKGGDATPEERDALKRLFESKYEDGTSVFNKSDITKYTSMRTEKTATEVIAEIKKELVTRLNAKDGPAPAMSAEEEKQAKMIF